ncbi:MAG: hypothetical protein U0807_03450 [Candidatus Binatia bacterium]
MASILDMMTDRALLGSVFGDASWAPWRAFAASVYGLPLDPEGAALYRQATARTAPPTEPARSIRALRPALGQEHRGRAARGLRGGVPALPAVPWRDAGRTHRGGRQRQAGVILDYCRGLLDACALTRSGWAATTGETLTLRSST